jgi:site-specific recombinase XerD
MVCIQKARGSSPLSSTGQRPIAILFTTSVGTPLDASHVRRDFRALCKKAGIEGAWAPRELRHTFVSVMSETGVAVEEIAHLAGHTSSRTTETIYGTSSARSSPPAPTWWTRSSPPTR